MKSFPAKGVDERRIYSVGLSADEAPGATFSGTPTVTVEVYDKSDVADAGAGDMPDGSPAKNSEAVTIEQESVPINRAISQAIQAGLAGAVYVVTFKCDLSDGQKFVEQVLLPVTKYVPTP